MTSRLNQLHAKALGSLVEAERFENPVMYRGFALGSVDDNPKMFTSTEEIDEYLALSEKESQVA